MRWEDDRKRLREALRLGVAKKTLHGLEATFLCTLVSHMRGKIHMGYYRAKEGGWRIGANAPIRGKDAPTVFAKRYGEYAQLYYEGCVIETLADQEAWIRKYCREVDFDFSSLQLLDELVQRVLDKDWEKETPK